jgi:uncharacterized protein YggE
MIRAKFSAAWMLAGVLAGTAAAQNIQINRDNKSIAINATDEATATADVAVIAVGFEVFGPDSATTYADGGRTSQAVLAALHKIGIEDKNIESSGQGIDKNNIFDEKESAEQRAKKQFVFRQYWQVTTKPEQAAQVIRDAVAAGANRTGSIDWRVSDHKALQAKAAEAALVKARAIAAQMAEGLHVKLGDLIYASNEAPQVVRPLMREAMTASMAAKAQTPPPLLELRPQTIHEQASVYAVFAIE